MKLKAGSYAVTLLVGFVLATSSGFSLAAKTRISGSWKNPDYSGQGFKTILVVAKADDITRKRAIEDTFTELLRKEGVYAHQGWRLLPGLKSDIEPELVRRVLERYKFDSLIVVSIKRVNIDNYYQPSQTYIVENRNRGFYGSIYGSYDVVRVPATRREDIRIGLETLLVDRESEDIVYSALSLTDNPKTLNKAVKSYTKVIMKDMRDWAMFDTSSE